MDCWFWIDDSDLDNIKIIDLENDNQVMDTKEALLMLDDGLVDLENDYDLTEEEILCYNKLMARVRAEK